jgi:hypothetical protein
MNSTIDHLIKEEEEEKKILNDLIDQKYSIKEKEMQKIK